MLLCKQMHRRWYLVYIDCLSKRDAKIDRLEKGNSNGKDRFRRSRSVRLAVQPLYGCGRSLPDGERRDLEPQRRPAPLRPVSRYVPAHATLRDGFSTIHMLLLMNGPARRGHFYLCCPESPPRQGLRHLRTVIGPALEAWHYAYKNAPPALA